MKWSIPAKTFLLGEYAALAGTSAFLITTSPCFALILTSKQEPSGIHSESPAGRLWQKYNFVGRSLIWHDPYFGRGGLGASSAQFLSCYLASCFLNDKEPNFESMLHAYYDVSWTGKGLRPSGYDVIAQSQHACVYINKQQNIIKSYAWPFRDLSFFLVHTGVKLTTHSHLEKTTLPQQINYLSSLVDEAKLAFEQADSQKIIVTINAYHQKLQELNLVAKHSLDFISQLKKYPEILAIKGCGALGADVLMIITSANEAPILAEKLMIQDWTILATEKNIYLHHPTIQTPYNLKSITAC